MQWDTAAQRHQWELPLARFFQVSLPNELMIPNEERSHILMSPVTECSSSAAERCMTVTTATPTLHFIVIPRGSPSLLCSVSHIPACTKPTQCSCAETERSGSTFWKGPAEKLGQPSAPWAACVPSWVCRTLTRGGRRGQGNCSLCKCKYTYCGVCQALFLQPVVGS